MLFSIAGHTSLHFQKKSISSLSMQSQNCCLKMCATHCTSVRCLFSALNHSLLHLSCLHLFHSIFLRCAFLCPIFLFCFFLPYIFLHMLHPFCCSEWFTVPLVQLWLTMANRTPCGANIRRCSAFGFEKSKQYTSNVCKKTLHQQVAIVTWCLLL